MYSVTMGTRLVVCLLKDVLMPLHFCIWGLIKDYLLTKVQKREQLLAQILHAAAIDVNS